jgi:ubiquinone biosynthesis accessory factor UbiJ
MATQSPFYWAAQALPDLAAQMAKQLSSSFHPPEWVIDETVNRLVLFLNHVLMAEPEAMARLARQKGQRIELLWERVHLQLTPTPAGLLERGHFKGFDLRLMVNEESALSLASTLARGEKPKVRIEGDVQLAAEVNWLIDHVRWDAEEDLARMIGDAPAHTLAQAARQAMTALRSFVAKRPGTELRTGGAA